MLAWLTPKKTVSDAPAATAAVEDAPAPVVRAPLHAKRDALMSVAVGGDKYKTMIDAKRLARKDMSIGTTAIKGKGKGKMPASPLVYDSGMPSRNVSSMFSHPEVEPATGPAAGPAPKPEAAPEPEAEPVSHKSSVHEPELDELWETASRALGMEEEQSTAPTSPAESAKGAQKKAKEAHGTDGAA